MSASQTAHQAGPARPHLRHLQQGVQEQLQPAAAPVGAHGHQDEGPGSPGEGGRSEGRPGGEADGPNPNPIPSTNQVRKNHACEACGKAFRDVYHLNRHRLSHSDEKPYSCPICQQRFKRKDRMSYHVRSHQGGVEKPYICPHCAKQLRLILKTSLVSSTPSCFPQTCTSAFATRDRLRAHLIRHEEKVPCHICGKLLSAAYITDHMRVHNQSQHHACHLCNRSKTRGGARGAFGGTGAGGVLLCQLCGVQCKTATQLQGHMGTHANQGDPTPDQTSAGPVGTTSVAVTVSSASTVGLLVTDCSGIAPSPTASTLGGEWGQGGAGVGLQGRGSGTEVGGSRGKRKQGRVGGATGAGVWIHSAH
uniref:MYC-associated zinc finger protein a (purine-binding transcription factor) n=1 Tax=Oreochromis niloticus TaxID=8128 RepID=A0A669CGQ7_ORENI